MDDNRRQQPVAAGTGFLGFQRKQEEELRLKGGKIYFRLCLVLFRWACGLLRGWALGQALHLFLRVIVLVLVWAV